MENADTGSETDTVDCPECGGRATVLARFTNAGVEYQRIRCPGSLTPLVTAGRPQQRLLRSA